MIDTFPSKEQLAERTAARKIELVKQWATVNIPNIRRHILTTVSAGHSSMTYSLTDTANIEAECYLTITEAMPDLDISWYSAGVIKISWA